MAGMSFPETFFRNGVGGGSRRGCNDIDNPRSAVAQLIHWQGTKKEEFNLVRVRRVVRLERPSL